LDDWHFYKLVNDIKYLILKEIYIESVKQNEAEKETKIDEVYYHKGAINFGRRISDLITSMEHFKSGSDINDFKIFKRKGTFEKRVERFHSEDSEEDLSE
jgi:hypothetical protein